MELVYLHKRFETVIEKMKIIFGINVVDSLGQTIIIAVEDTKHAVVFL